jgi:hypothetical protein
MNGGRPSIPPGITAELLLDIFDLPVSFHRCLVPITGGVTAALMLSQAIWTSQELDPEVGGLESAGPRKSGPEEDRGSRGGSRKRRGEPCAPGAFLEERRAGMPAKLWFRVTIGRRRACIAGARKPGSPMTVHRPTHERPRTENRNQRAR